MPSIEVPSVSAEQAVQGAFTIVDVRSPGEFAAGSVPGALNLPLLDDRERAQVGIAYDEQGPQQARLLAMDLVSPRLPAFLRRLQQANEGRERLAVMCWRGGERSRNVVLLLSLVGVHALQVTGGYKAYRRWVLAGLASWRPDRPVFTLYGYTGSGKTELLRRLARLAPESRPRPAVIDLEGLALHRGSLLGGLNQPGSRTQKDFEALVWEALRKAEGDYFVLEGEGSRIGRLLLPDGVARAVREGLPVHVTASVERRAEAIMQEYDPLAWNILDQSRFSQALERIGERLPGETLDRLRTCAAQGDYLELVRELLVSYYDPLYLRSSVEGRDFVLTLAHGADTWEDTRRLAAGLGRLLTGTGEPDDKVDDLSKRGREPWRAACSR